MLFGIPCETKIGEHRVAITPKSARELTSRKQTVLMQSGAGSGSGYTDDSELSAGCQIAATADEVWGTADLIVKVKEPQPSEYGLIRENSALFTFLRANPPTPVSPQ